MGIFRFFEFLVLFIAIFFDNTIPFYILFGITAVLEVVAIIRSIVYSKKTFVCANCGEEFKLKWTYLYLNYQNWGSIGSQEVVEKDNESHKTVWVHCRKCGSLKAWYK